MGSLRDQIFAVVDVEEEEHFIPEWGTKVTIRGLTGAERDTFEGNYSKHRDNGTVRAALAVLACRDADGKKIFQPGDAQALAGKSATALSRIFDVAARLAGITKDDAEELMGNSQATPSDGSPSA